jgi:hypothetical protein
MARKTATKNSVMGADRPAYDRRARSRLPDPSCPTCNAGPEHVQGTVRTSFRVFYRCEKCSGVWDTARPQRR